MAINQENAGAQLLKSARRFTGQPYVYGGLDCSKLTQDAAAGAGILLPRTTETQYLLYPPAPHVDDEPGDLWFIPGDPIDANPGHVMIFVKDGVMHGAIFQAEMTGTLIGQFEYDTANRPEFRTRPALAHPQQATIDKAGLLVVDPVSARQAQRNGWAIRNWNGTNFPVATNRPTRTTTLYASVNFRKKR